MRAVHTEDVALSFNSPHRSGDIGIGRLTRGQPGNVDNYEFSIIQMGATYTTPRHHHNFDQVHYILAGTHTWAPGSYIPEGHVAYFAEGVYYGPQQGCDAVVLALQVGGAGGSGFMDYDTLRRASEELASKGSFDGGTYRRPSSDDDGGAGSSKGERQNQDGYEAVWQHVHGAPVAYPRPRYGAPIIVDPAAFAWIASSDEAGVHHKHLLTVSERRLSIGFTRLEPGAEHVIGPLDHRRVQYVVDGRLSIDGGEYGAGTAFGFESGESAHATTRDGAEIYWIDLPRFG